METYNAIPLQVNITRRPKGAVNRTVMNDGGKIYMSSQGLSLRRASRTTAASSRRFLRMKVKDIFEDHLGYRAKMGNSKKTISEVSRFLYGPIYRSVGELHVNEITELDLAEIVQTGRQYGVYGSQRAVLYFRQLLMYAKKAGYQVNVDISDMKLPQVPDGKIEYLSPEEIEQVRNCFDLTTEQGVRARALMEFLLATGLRIGEACSIDQKDVNLETKEIEVLNIKTKQWGKVYVTDNAIEWLKRYLQVRTLEHPALFTSGRGRLLPVTSRNYMRKATSKLGLSKKVCHHIYRRTMGTTLAHNKVDINTTKTLLRHASERTTLRYYTGTDDKRCKEVHNEIMQNI